MLVEHVTQRPMLSLLLCKKRGKKAINYIWATTWQNQQSGMCAQRRLGSAWAAAEVQADLSLRCPYKRKLGSLETHWAHSKDSDQTGRMPRLIWVFVGRTLILLVLSCPGSYLIDLKTSNHHRQSQNAALLHYIATCNFADSQTIRYGNFWLRTVARLRIVKGQRVW